LAPPNQKTLAPEKQAQANDAFIGLWTGPGGKEDYGKASTVTVAQIRQALADGADIHAKDTIGTSALLLAAGGGNLDCVKFLMDQGLDIKDKDNNGATALMRAAKSGNVECIQFCWSHDMEDVNARNIYGETALKIAEDNNNYPDAANFLRQVDAVE
jgi:ankyrin repeat protein